MSQLQFDATAGSLHLIPHNPFAVASYIDNYGGYSELERLFPDCPHRSSITIYGGRARFGDFEAGAMAYDRAGEWVKEQKAQDEEIPGCYASISNMPAVLDSVYSAGYKRLDVVVWSAHTGAGDHICAPDTCGALGTGITADGTQDNFAYDGLNVDASTLSPRFFRGITPPPPVKLPPDPNHYRWYPSSDKAALGIRGGPFDFGTLKLDERAVVIHYDQMMRHPRQHIAGLRNARADCALLAERVTDHAHELAINGHPAWNTILRLGWRNEKLRDRAGGRRIAA